MKEKTNETITKYKIKAHLTGWHYLRQALGSGGKGGGGWSKLQTTWLVSHGCSCAFPETKLTLLWSGGGGGGSEAKPCCKEWQLGLALTKWWGSNTEDHSCDWNIISRAVLRKLAGWGGVKGGEYNDRFQTDKRMTEMREPRVYPVPSWMVNNLKI